VDKNNPQDLYDWFIRVRMDEPRNCKELLDCVKAFLYYMENMYRNPESSQLSPILNQLRQKAGKNRTEFIRKKLLLGEDLAWSSHDLEEIRREIHLEIKRLEKRKRRQAWELRHAKR
jgi:hypothetical protein